STFEQFQTLLFLWPDRLIALGQFITRHRWYVWNLRHQAVKGFKIRTPCAGSNGFGSPPRRYLSGQRDGNQLINGGLLLLSQLLHLFHQRIRNVCVQCCHTSLRNLTRKSLGRKIIIPSALAAGCKWRTLWVVITLAPDSKAN